MIPVKPCVRIVRVIGWRHRHAVRSAVDAGRRAGVALATTIVDSSDEPMDHVVSALAATAHVSHDTMHASLKFVLAFLAAFVTL
jgi:hypothetical protein